jgi:hypothetical protein
MPTPYAVVGAEDQHVLDGILVQQSGGWWLRVDGQAQLFGPLNNDSIALPGDRVCVAVGQQGTMYVVWPGDGKAAATGGDRNYVHVQGPPAAVWSVAHNLGKYPAVEVVDTGDSVVLPSVHYLDVNNVQLTFGSPTSGKAFMN